MCLQSVKVKSVSPYGVKRAFVPCGKCKDCRKAYKSQWSLRLSCELSARQQQGWYVCFCTLTYNDENLPHVPEDLIKYFDSSLDSPACFDRKHVRDFIVDIRRDLHEFYGVKSLVYMVCSEYGSHTRRPHYHCIFSVDPKCPPDVFYSYVKKYWKYGFVFPKHLNGGMDSKGHQHMPFLVKGTARFAGAYCAKYCCKDLDFDKSLARFDIDYKSKEWKRYQCFHIQSKGLGYSYLVGRSLDELQDIFLHGIHFPGDKHVHELPVYFRNKILFNPCYIVVRNVYKGITLQDEDLFTSRPDDVLEAEGYRVEYKRLVRREATDFFKHYKIDVWQRRVDYWRGLFEKLSKSYLVERGLDPSVDFDENIVDNPKELAQFCVTYYGVDYASCFALFMVDAWFLRYDDSIDVTNVPLVDEHWYNDFVARLDYIFYTLAMLNPSYSDKDIRVARVSDAFHSQT